MQLLEDAGVRLELAELEMLHRHISWFEQLVGELQARADEGTLDEPWQKHWEQLRTFLEAEELEGSEIPQLTDGRYCCQWRTRGLSAGERECQQYDAWYIFAWAACTGAAIARSADATLQAGECRDMPGCP